MSHGNVHPPVGKPPPGGPPPGKSGKPVGAPVGAWRSLRGAAMAPAAKRARSESLMFVMSYWIATVTWMIWKKKMLEG